MADSETKKRRSPIPWRPPADRWDEFIAMVAASGLSRNAFLTESVFGRSRHRPAELKLLTRLLHQCADLKGRLPDIEMSGVADDHVLLIEEMRDELIEIRSALFLLMNHKP